MDPRRGSVVKLSDLTIDEEPEPTDEAIPDLAPKPRGRPRRCDRFNQGYRVTRRSEAVKAAVDVPRPEWMGRPELLPRRPPGR
jgi:hypothetical protein